MTHQTHPFALSDGSSLFGQSWTPSTEPKAVVLLVHGLGEHSDRYPHVAQQMTDAGFKLMSYDLRYHGRSPGKRAYIERFDRLVADLEEIAQQVHLAHQDIPLFLYCQSLGGAVVSLFLIRNSTFPVKGAVLSSPALQVGADISPFLVKLAKWINMLAPKLKVQALNVDNLSRNREVVEQYINDPLVYSGKNYARTGYESIRAIDEIQARMEEFQTPVLILHGTEDGLTNPEGSKQLYARAGVEDKQLRLFEGWYHELHNEPDGASVIQEIISWIEHRVDG
ncbi:MAG: lysophospholipase [Bacteroidota bacterium]